MSGEIGRIQCRRSGDERVGGHLVSRDESGRQGPVRHRQLVAFFVFEIVMPDGASPFEYESQSDHDYGHGVVNVRPAERRPLGRKTQKQSERVEDENVRHPSDSQIGKKRVEFFRIRRTQQVRRHGHDRKQVGQIARSKSGPHRFREHPRSARIGKRSCQHSEEHRERNVKHESRVHGEIRGDRFYGIPGFPKDV